MNLHLVTITGADSDINPHDLADISQEYPWVEWGILLSDSKSGTERYPHCEWIMDLKRVASWRPMNLSGHLCGKWMREVLDGHWTVLRDCSSVSRLFRRVQLNCHNRPQALTHAACLEGMKKVLENGALFDPLHPSSPYILPWNGKGYQYLQAVQEFGIGANLLFDVSGGKGLEGPQWPMAPGNIGYAGGLSPENLAENLEKISQVAGDNYIWIDVESGVRTNNKFDLTKVRAFLDIAKPHVKV